MNILLLTQLPFWFEITGDLYLINKGQKDIHWGWRIPLFIIVSLDYHQLITAQPVLQVAAYKLLLCLVPYCFFDVVLNVIRFKSFKKWDYLGESKKWDRNLLRFNPWFLLAIRVSVFIALLILANQWT